MDPPLTLGRRPVLEVLDGIGDIHAAAVQSRRVQRPVEHPAGRAHKRRAPAVLGIAGLLTDHENARVAGPFPEDGLRGVPVEVTAVAALGRPP